MERAHTKVRPYPYFIGIKGSSKSIQSVGAHLRVRLIRL